MTNIASRRNKVDDIVKRDDAEKKYKVHDKNMIKKSFWLLKPEEGAKISGQEIVKNSGKKKKRRPFFNFKQLMNFLKDGYKIK